ncbi:MAG: DUF3857 domain-containing protein [Elusimicrobiales bacterium]
MGNVAFRSAAAVAGIAALAFSLPCFGETVLLRSGGEISGRIVSADGRYVSLARGGKKLSKIKTSQVDEIYFSGRPEPSSPAVPAARPSSVAEAARAAELFAAAKDFSAKWPDAPAIVLEDGENWLLRADGTWSLRRRYAAQILKSSSAGRLAEFGAGFERGREKLGIIRASVHLPGGKTIPFSEANLRVADPQPEQGIYADMGEMSYSFPLVSTGVIVDYEYEIEVFRPFRNDFFFPGRSFASPYPCRGAFLEVSVPQARKFYYSASGFAGAGAEPRIQEGGAVRRYRWELSGIAPEPQEPAMPPEGDSSPRVKGALFNDWGRICDWLEPMYRERIARTPELEKLAREAAHGAFSDAEKTAAVYHFVQANVRYVGVKMGVASGWGGYSAQDTWRRRYGCCIDKTLLMCALLEILGVRSSPVLLDTNLSPRHDFALPDIDFEHAIVRAGIAGKDVFLDPSGYDSRYPAMDAMDYGVDGLDVFRRAAVRIPDAPAEDNSSRYDYSVDVDASGGMRVRFRAGYSGPREAELRSLYRYKTQEERGRLLASWIDESMPGAQLSEWKAVNADSVSLPFSLEAAYYGPAAAGRAGALSIISLPDFEVYADETALDSRKLDIVYSAPYSKRYHYEINLPAGAAIVSLPGAARLENRRGFFSLECAAHGPRITCDGEMRVDSRIVPRGEYAGFRAFLEGAARASDVKIFAAMGAGL